MTGLFLISFSEKRLFYQKFIVFLQKNSRNSSSNEFIWIK